MNKIQPITTLRDTEKLEKELEANKGEIFITKNGYGDFVILSNENYEALKKERPYREDAPKKKFAEPLKLDKPQSDPLGFVKVRAASIKVNVGNVNENKLRILEQMKKAQEDGVRVLVLPELCLSGYTCGDLFLGSSLNEECEKAIKEIEEASKEFDLFVSFGSPLKRNNKLYNCAINIHKGKLLGVTPKSNIPNYGEFYEGRYFEKAPEEVSEVAIAGKSYPFGSKIIYVDEDYLKLQIGVEICEDMWVSNTPSTALSLNGATMILNLSSSNEVVGKKEYRHDLVKMTSARLCSAYVYADSGDGESTTDLVLGSHNMVAENGKILAESPLFEMKSATTSVDLEKLENERIKTMSYEDRDDASIMKVVFSMPLAVPDKLERAYSMNPFIPKGKEIDLNRVSLILRMQAEGLLGRLKAINCHKVVVGLSGGLDSTLALLVSYDAFKKEGYPLKDIIAITLPCFGTSQRTHDNAVRLSNELGVSFREINIKESVTSHFKDIGQDSSSHDLTYENAQARERTQVLLDVAGKENAIMVGTGDLSELCLGWTTFNGDHMSNYGVNASIPKTLVRYLVEGFAILHPEAKDSLNDIVDTPISPELLPMDEHGAIAQKTEDKVGPYELNDFFIYQYLRNGFSPRKIFFLAKVAYEGVYDAEFIKKWLKAFFTRFYHNQFKRSCLPDGAKVGTVAISPRGDWRMPSDADVRMSIKEIEEM